MTTRPKTQNPPSGSYQAPAVEKAIDILEYLAERQNGASMTELCRALERSMGELYRVMIALERRRFVYKSVETDRYSLSLRLFELSHKHPPIAQLVRAAHPVMDELARRSMQSCHLAMAQDMQLYVLASTDSPLPMHYSVKVGATFPLLETSSGVVITAFAGDVRIETVLGEEEKELRTGYRERFDRIRRIGYEVWDSKVVRGVTNLSVAIRDHSGMAKAALTIPYLEQAGAIPTRKDALALLVDAATTLSRELGHGDALASEAVS